LLLKNSKIKGNTKDARNGKEVRKSIKKNAQKEGTNYNPTEAVGM